jgi:DNA polymerase bacteriophage-type
MTRVLRIDVETYSGVDLIKCGAALYVRSPDFEVMLFAYKWVIDGVKHPTICVDLKAGESIPPDVFAALTDPGVLKTAWNAPFELATLGRHFGLALDPRQWECTMVHAMYCGLPGQLGQCAQVLKAKNQKDFRGSSLIKFFCLPCKATKKNGGRTRNLPEHDPERWALFKSYNIADVDCEDELSDRVAKIHVPPEEWTNWRLDYEMNERGVRVDLPLVRNAITFGGQLKEKLTARAVAICKLDNPNSVKQLKSWLSEELEIPILSLTKDDVPDLIDLARLRESEAAELLSIRQQLGKASTSKYDAMQRTSDKAGVIRGLTQFYGANRTGRAAGRLVQQQNMRRNDMPTGYIGAAGKVPFDELDHARALLRSGDFETIETLWDTPMDVLSQLVRTAFIPDRDHVFAPIDWSAIEARGLAWLADETWRLGVFKTHGKIYEASAAKMFGIPMSEITKKHPARQKGKVAELACGYQGGFGALIRMGALEMGLREDELQPIIDAWRAANLKISGQTYKDQPAGLWENLNEAALRVLRLGGCAELDHGVAFRKDKGMLLMRLPSGRELCYVKPSIAEGKYGPEVRFWGVSQLTKQWAEQKSYGGRFAENLVQAFARDLLYYKLRQLDAAGLHDAVRFHVHDEVVPSLPIIGAPEQQARVTDIFLSPVPWAPGLPLAADTFLTPYFRKDD